MSNPISELTKINELNPYDLNCNIFTVYDFDSGSIQELLCKFFEKINECIKVSNATFKLAEWLVSVGLKQEVALTLDKWLSDGTIQSLINEKIFKELNDKLNTNILNTETNKNDIIELKRKLNNIVTVDVSDYPTLQLAHDKVVELGGGVLNISKDISQTIPFEWDVRKVIINGNGHSLTFDLPDKNEFALKTISSESWTHPFHQATNGITRLKMYFNRGNGILLSGVDSAKACSHISFDKCTIADTKTCLKFGDNSYLVQFRDCDIFDSDNLLEILGDVSNSGENINFVGCALYNSLKGITAKSGICDLFFTNCSFDYFEKGSIFDVDNSKVFLTNCHIEFDLSKFGGGVVPIVCAGDSGVISIDNSVIMGANSSNTSIPHLFHTDGEQSRINLTKSFLYGLKVTSGWLCGGTGKLFTSKNILNVVPECDLKISPNTTQSISGSMMVDKVIDAILTEDTSSITSSLDGTNIKVSMVNDGEGYKFGKSVKIQKIGGAGTVGAVLFFSPIEKGSTNNLDIVIKRLSGSGVVNITLGYCSVNGVNIVREEKGVITKDISNSWEHISSFIKQAPMWATHVYFNIATSQCTESEFRIGEISVNSF